MLTIPELRERKQPHRKKLRVNLRSNDSEQRRFLQSTGTVEAAHWNEEVVRALATRMPGGLSTITRECKFCQSLFYPCLCSDSSGIRHSRMVVAPRVTREAEARRLLSEPMGNLRELVTTLDVLGMDKEKIHISGPRDVDDKKVELTVEPYSDCEILWRENGTYVVNPKAPPVEQELVFDKDELQRLQSVLVERDNCFTVRERWEGRHVKPSYVTYRFAEEALKDLKLQKVKTAKESYWEVCKVKDPKDTETGVANAAGVVPGQRLLEIDIALPDPRQLKLIRTETVDLADIKLKWESVKVEDMVDIPKCFSDWDCTAADAGLSFPCRLKIDLVAPGSKLIAIDANTRQKMGQMLSSSSHCTGSGSAKASTTEAAQHVSLESLESLEDQLGDGQNGPDRCRIRFERPVRERICRTKAAVRHRHFTEGSAEGWRDDLALFETWLATRALSPNHLKFVFRKLLESVRKELTQFERKKTQRFQSLLSKSIRWVDLKSRLDQAKATKSTSMKTMRHEKELKCELEVINSELEFLFDKVPLSFLKDLKALSGGFATQGDHIGKTTVSVPEPSGAIGGRSRTLQSGSVMTQLSSMREAAAMLEDHFDQTIPVDERKRLTEAFKHLHEVSEEYEQALKGRGRGKKLTSEEAFANDQHEDGRLSFKEFEKEMLRGGVNWLGEEELRNLFDSMDADGSGKLNLGELQCTAIRLTDLAERVQRFCEENEGMSADTCLLEFGHLLQMGDDLVGSQMRPLIPDSHISASSFFLDHPEHGFGQMWRSRLDCDDSCWVASDSDPNPYIQWRFPSCREIRAVATKGRPDTACWVTSFRIKYLEEEIEDDEEIPADDDLRWKDYTLKGHVVTLEGNFDMNTRKDNFLVPFIASCVRICPQEKRGHCHSMRASLYGSFRPPHKTSEQSFELFCSTFKDLNAPHAKSMPQTRLMSEKRRPKSPQ